MPIISQGEPFEPLNPPEFNVRRSRTLDEPVNSTAEIRAAMQQQQPDERLKYGDVPGGQIGAALGGLGEVAVGLGEIGDLIRRFGVVVHRIVTERDAYEKECAQLSARCEQQRVRIESREGDLQRLMGVNRDLAEQLTRMTKERDHFANENFVGDTTNAVVTDAMVDAALAADLGAPADPKVELKVAPWARDRMRAILTAALAAR